MRPAFNLSTRTPAGATPAPRGRSEPSSARPRTATPIGGRMRQAPSSGYGQPPAPRRSASRAPVGPPRPAAHELDSGMRPHPVAHRDPAPVPMGADSVTLRQGDLHAMLNSIMTLTATVSRQVPGQIPGQVPSGAATPGAPQIAATPGFPPQGPTPQVQQTPHPGAAPSAPVTSPGGSTLKRDEIERIVRRVEQHFTQKLAEATQAVDALKAENARLKEGHVPSAAESRQGSPARAGLPEELSQVRAQLQEEKRQRLECEEQSHVMVQQHAKQVDTMEARIRQLERSLQEAVAANAASAAANAAAVAQHSSNAEQLHHILASSSRSLSPRPGTDVSRPALGAGGTAGGEAADPHAMSSVRLATPRTMRSRAAFVAASAPHALNSTPLGSAPTSGRPSVALAAPGLGASGLTAAYNASVAATAAGHVPAASPAQGPYGTPTRGAPSPPNLTTPLSQSTAGVAPPAALSAAPAAAVGAVSMPPLRTAEVARQGSRAGTPRPSAGGTAVPPPAVPVAAPTTAPTNGAGAPAAEAGRPAEATVSDFLSSINKELEAISSTEAQRRATVNSL